MRWLFSGCMTVEKPQKESCPDLHVAVNKVDAQVMSLEKRIAEAEQETRELIALGPGNTAARQRALQAVKRKKMYEQQRDQLLGTQFNLETLAFQHDQAELTLTAVNAMKQGHMELKRATDGLDAGHVDELRADMEDLAEDMRAINEVLSGAADANEAEEDLLAAEYAKVEEELAAEALAAKHRAAAEAEAAAYRSGAGGSRSASRGAAERQQQRLSAARARPERARYVA